MYWTEAHLRRLRQSALHGDSAGYTAQRVPMPSGEVDRSLWIALGRTEAEALAILNGAAVVRLVG